LAQGRPLKASDLLPLGSVPEEALRKGGVAVPAAWRGAFPANKETSWEVRRFRCCWVRTKMRDRQLKWPLAFASACCALSFSNALGDAVSFSLP
jgi:hypothetical protein